MTGSEPARITRPDEADDRRLVAAAQRDRARFADLYSRYFETVYAYVARRVSSRDEREDVVSEVFRKVLANLPRYKWTGAPFASWLFKIASNLIADRAKREARERKVSLTDDRDAGRVHQRGDGVSLKQQTDLEDLERQAQLFRLVGELPDDQRRVVAWRFAENKSIKEIAAELGRTEGAVKQLQFRALQTLRAKLAANDR